MVWYRLLPSLLFLPRGTCNIPRPDQRCDVGTVYPLYVDASRGLRHHGTLPTEYKCEASVSSGSDQPSLVSLGTGGALFSRIQTAFIYLGIYLASLHIVPLPRDATSILLSMGRR